MIKVIIIDDEKHALITLSHSLKEFDDIEIIAEIQDSRVAVEKIKELKPDLVFLDIEMPHLSGIDVLKSFENPDFKAVFVTAYNHYAIQALKMNAFDYLLKPLDQDEIEFTLEKFRNKEIFTEEVQIQQLSKFNIQKLSDTIALSTSKGLVFIKVDEIMYFIAESSYTNVVLSNGEKYLVSKSLSTFEEVLEDHPVLFRNHKSSMVNLSFIKQYNRGDGGEIIMRDGENLILSRTKKNDFLNLFRKI